MSLWSRLFGRAKEPEEPLAEYEEDKNRLIKVAYRDGKRHGPYKRLRKDGTLLEEGTYVDGEREGAFVIHGRDVRIEGTYRAGKLDGVRRTIKADGSVEQEEYRAGEVVSGNHEKRDEIHKDWVRERGTIVNGQRDGVWREYGITSRDGRKPLMKRCHYKAGVLDGPFETWHYDGVRAIEGEYRDGLRVGRWVYWRHDGSTSAELEYVDGAVASWRWLGRDGEREPVAFDDDEDLVRWLALGDAWDSAAKDGPGGAQSALRAWPAEELARPLAWLDHHIEREGRPPRWDAYEWIEAMVDSDEIDPRTRYVDVIELDNHDWDETQTRRLQRFAPQILTLGLHECGAAPDISALFDVPWPKLTTLFLHECGTHDDVIAKIYPSPIEELSLTYEALSATAISKLVAAPWFPMLRVLQLTVEDRTIFDLLPPHGMPELRELGIESYDLQITAADVAALIDPEQRPTLAKLTLSSIGVEGELPQREGVEIEVLYSP